MANNPTWLERALDKLRDFASTAKGDFTGNDVREAAHAGGLDLPSDPRAWGGVMKMAERKGFITKVGYAPSNNPNANSSPMAVWRTAS